MKKAVFVLFIVFTTTVRAQFTQSIFSKDPVIHLETWQQQPLYFALG
jgi:hypothetical protein